MNRVTAIGRMAADPELRSASSAKKVCSLRLAIARRERAGEDQGAVFVDVVCFDGLAVACASALRKGSKVLIDGRLEHRTWQGPGRLQALPARGHRTGGGRQERRPMPRTSGTPTRSAHALAAA